MKLLAEDLSECPRCGDCWPRDTGTCPSCGERMLPRLPRLRVRQGVADIGLSLCAMGFCAECGRTLVSAVHREDPGKGSSPIPRGTLCGRCAPLSPAGNIDHAEWVARRRGAPDG